MIDYENELDETTLKLLDKICAGVEVPSEEEENEVLDYQDSK